MAFLAIFLTTITAIGAYLLFWRVQVVLDYKRSKPIRHGRRNPHEPTHLMIVLGSGGHTAEMIAMLERAVNDTDPVKRLDWRDYNHRSWVVSAGDSISAQRAKDFEEMAQGLTNQDSLMVGRVKRATDIGPGTYEIHTVPRAREIHQPLSTSPISSLKCLLACYKLLKSQMRGQPTHDYMKPWKGERDYPDIILCNGPATGTVMVAAAIILRFFNVDYCGTRGRMRTIYVESWARVKKLSLSGELLEKVADRLLVQWPQLQKRGSKAQYMGVLV